MKRGVQSNSAGRRKHTVIEKSSPAGSSKLHDVLLIAEHEGLLSGRRTQVVRGRMPAALVTRAKKRTGINSDTELIEVALANIAVADDYADWLLSRRGVVGREVDLEF